MNKYISNIKNLNSQGKFALLILLLITGFIFFEFVNNAILTFNNFESRYMARTTIALLTFLAMSRLLYIYIFKRLILIHL